MGHYAAEMSCKSCGMLHCRCPTKPDPQLKMWMIEDYAPIRGDAYLEKWKHSATAKFALMFGAKYKTKQEALNAVPALLEAAIESNQQMANNLLAQNAKLKGRLDHAILQVSPPP